ncbi:hypothetical protein SETIT_4G207900v2 [Setaria italica]|uniref:Uncharacterized protein n=1 Tax=Setaria italica TaxID=4555 RepID=A0A368QWD9_SETIT|nr:hypothetical protein SETIT_4G207900v2 [Setaria italica]
MPVPYAPHPTSFHSYSSWDGNDPWAHTPSYFRPYHVEYAAPREPSCATQPYVENDHFEQKDRSSVQKKKRVVKQVYQMKTDGCKDKSLDLNSVSKKPINVLSTLATNGKGKEKSAIDPPSAKSEQNKLKAPKNKKKEKKGMAWVPKGSIQIQNKNDVQANGAAQLKGKKKSERQSSNMRFVPNHQNYWSLHHPFALQMSYVPMSLNSFLDMFGYPSYSYFDPWMPHGSLYHGDLSPNYYAY